MYHTSDIPELSIDTSSIKPDFKIVKLEIAINETNRKIAKLEKDLNERMNELELMVSANLTKQENIINELIQNHHHKDIYDVLNNHKQALELLNNKI